MRASPNPGSFFVIRLISSSAACKSFSSSAGSIESLKPLMALLHLANPRQYRTRAASARDYPRKAPALRIGAGVPRDCPRNPPAGFARRLASLTPARVRPTREWSLAPTSQRAPPPAQEPGMFHCVAPATSRRANSERSLSRKFMESSAAREKAGQTSSRLPSAPRNVTASLRGWRPSRQTP